MKKILLISILFLVSITMFANNRVPRVVRYNGLATPDNVIEVYGHRGVRSLVPEQTMPAYKAALRIGVDYVDMDINMTEDGVLVITHNLGLNPDITKNGKGKWIMKAKLIYKLTLNQVRKYDVGDSKPGTEYAKLFPYQEHLDNVKIPTLVEAIKYVKKIAGNKVGFQIEIKNDPTKPEDYVEGIINGSKKALSKSITHIESTLSHHQKFANEIMTHIIPYTGKSIRIGITGVPGVGKSTFIEALGIYLIEQGHKVAVLAIDPTSTISGGSILADKTRMEKLSSLKDAFIRPSPSGNYLGGVAQKTRETMLLCEAAGYDVVIIETVGVGQSETEAAAMVDFFLFLALANAGDELQGIKKGILELADAIAINKADKKNIIQADLAKKIYENALHIVNPASEIWTPKVLTCSALEKIGIKEIWNVVIEHNKAFKKSGELAVKRHKQAVKWMWTIIEDGIKHHFINLPEVKKIIPELEKEITADRQTPANAARKVLNIITGIDN